ncbi:MAG TPA: MATE family efflux transporter [Burkholderiales bacterium]|nr:MATE family efflux transporter [Burkholderiales bacterium]
MTSSAPSIARSLVRLAWPVLIAQLAVIASGVLDTIMSGRYSAVDLAAVGIGASVYFSVFIGLMGVVLALSPIAAQLYGAKRDSQIGEEVRQTAWLALGLAVVGVLLLAFPEPFLRLAGAPPEVESRTRDYLLGIAWALPAMLLFRVFFALTTAVSRPRAVMLINLIYFAVKLPLNALFIYGALGAPELGGPGCAVSTAISSWLICVIAWIYCARHPFYERFQVFAKWSWPDPRSIWNHLKLGVPMGLTFFVEVTSFTFMALFLARLGAATSAGHQIASNVTAVLYMFGIAVGNATAVLTAQAIGAGDPRRARHTGLAGMGIMFAVSSCAGVAIFFAAKEVVVLYTHDAAVQAIAAQLMVFVAFYQVFDTAQVVIVNALRGYKIAFIPMLVYTVALWGVGLGGGYALGLMHFEAANALALTTPMGAAGFWLAGVLSVAAAGGVLFAYFLRVSRQHIAASA